MISLVIIMRLIGGFQYWEWLTFDLLLRLRPSESTDERIIIIGITEEDIKKAGTYPLSDQQIAELIKKLQQYKPRAIGLDIVRDISVEPGHQNLVKIFENSKNLIGVEKILSPTISKPPNLSTDKIGFVDILIDLDGRTRRSLLGSVKPENSQDYGFSFSLKLAELYLRKDGILLENGLKDAHAMRFNLVEIPRFFSQTGGYQKADNFGVQMLLNFRNNVNPFRRLSLDNIEQGNVNPEWLKDRVIIIGVTSPSIKDFVNTSAVQSSELPGQIYGVEFHGHVVSQIISAVEDQRPLIKSWNEIFEYLWLTVWGLLGLIISRFIASPRKGLLTILISSLSLVIISYLFLLYGWWIPLIPSLVVLGLNGILLASFFQYQRKVKTEIETRQLTIENAFTSIHNGPLQTLSNLLKGVRDKNIPEDSLLQELETLNQEIRSVGEYLKLDGLSKEETLRLVNGTKLDLNHPLHQLFYQVYTETLTRNLPNLITLKIKARSFEPIEDKHLNYQQKRELCQFLEESLCNIGKHANGVTRINATGQNKEDFYHLVIKDNGLNQFSNYQGRGTQQCQILAKNLGGEFKRESLSPKGTLCQLKWPLNPSYSISKKIRQILEQIKNFKLKS
ncbi:sensor histidine kinase [Crocosphaera sp. Alani8]|uniref:sensor histidine kinase n=1 Tax=Crocosphaera sp. Alani8 TaxID=3038952 RepID=UPI00313E854A